MSSGPDCREVAETLDSILKTAAFDDYPNALNGLQVEGDRPVRRVAAAVDACLPVIEEAVRAEADLLLVHHGMFWAGLRPFRGRHRAKLALMLNSGLALYSSHLPLDGHPEFGNNALLAKELGLTAREPFLETKGQKIGWKGTLSIDRDVLMQQVRDRIWSEARLAPGGPSQVSKLGICSGGAGDAVRLAVEEGVDTFLTGEGAHWTYTEAEELGINLIYAGHYATEVFGVRALARRIAEVFEAESFFIDHPTGL